MQKAFLPYKQLLFVCNNARKPGERISCAGEGRCGVEVLTRLKSFVKENRLESQVRVARSGCQEKCERGVNVAVMPQNEYLSQVTLDDVPQIIETYLKPH